MKVTPEADVTQSTGEKTHHSAGCLGRQEHSVHSDCTVRLEWGFVFGQQRLSCYPGKVTVRRSCSPNVLNTMRKRDDFLLLACSSGGGEQHYDTSRLKRTKHCTVRRGKILIDFVLADAHPFRYDQIDPNTDPSAQPGASLVET